MLVSGAVILMVSLLGHIPIGLPQIVADELGAAWETVGVEPAPLAKVYANPLAEEEGWPKGTRLTAGATSVRAFEQPLREAAAVWRLDAKRDLWRLPARYVGRYGEVDARRPLQLLRRQEAAADGARARCNSPAYKAKSAARPAITSSAADAASFALSSAS